MHVRSLKPPPPPSRLPQADLIGKAKETDKDRAMRERLHLDWEAQQDDKDVQQVLRGLKGGFRRRRGAGFLDDEVRGQRCMVRQGLACACAPLCALGGGGGQARACS